MDPRSQPVPVSKLKPREADRPPLRPPVTKPPKAAAGSGRIAALDALRGFDMFWIIGGGGVVKSLAGLIALLVPAAWLGWLPSAEWFHAQMDHVPWEGFVAWDLIMPLFLFVVGASMPFSFAKRRAAGQSTAAIYKKVFRRVALLWILGMVAQGHLLDFDWLGAISAGHFRDAAAWNLQLFSNTLQAIAIGYLVAAVALIHFAIPLQVVLCVVLLVGYWLLMLLLPVPGQGAGIWEEHVNLARWIDDFILRGFGDGTTYAWILPSLGFAGTTLWGVFSGHILRSAWRPRTKVLVLTALGGVLLALGALWAGWFEGLGGRPLVGAWRCPLIKHLFSSSMVLWACGWSYLLLALFYLLIDVLGFRRWSFFFVVIGANAIFVYMLVHTIRPSLLQMGTDLAGGLAHCVASWGDFGAAVDPALPPLTAFALLWLVLLYLYRKGTLIRV